LAVRIVASRALYLVCGYDLSAELVGELAGAGELDLVEDSASIGLTVGCAR
jgi:hypothetical protein